MSEAVLTAPPFPAHEGDRIGYRDATLDDFDFVQGTLLNHFYEEAFWSLRLTTRIFFDGHTPLVRSLLQQASVVIACERDDPTSILGFVVFEKGGGPDGADVIDFIYVKKAWRKLGIGKMLLIATGLETGNPTLEGVHVTFCTKAWFHTKQKSGLEEHYKAIYWPYGQWRAFHL
jgi:GNAT superfamily N-acetyltransferase